MSGAPNHPATNGAAERLVQTLKSSLKKLTEATKGSSSTVPYAISSLSIGKWLSPSELLNNRHIRAMLPSSVHINQERQAQEATKSLPEELISTGHCE